MFLLTNPAGPITTVHKAKIADFEQLFSQNNRHSRTIHKSSYLSCASSLSAQWLRPSFNVHTFNVQARKSLTATISPMTYMYIYSCCSEDILPPPSSHTFDLQLQKQPSIHKSLESIIANPPFNPQHTKSSPQRAALPPVAMYSVYGSSSGCSSGSSHGNNGFNFSHNVKTTTARDGSGRTIQVREEHTHIRGGGGPGPCPVHGPCHVIREEESDSDEDLSGHLSTMTLGGRSGVSRAGRSYNPRRIEELRSTDGGSSGARHSGSRQSISQYSSSRGNDSESSGRHSSSRHSTSRPSSSRPTDSRSQYSTSRHTDSRGPSSHSSHSRHPSSRPSGELVVYEERLPSRHESKSSRRDTKSGPSSSRRW